MVNGRCGVDDLRGMVDGLLQESTGVVEALRAQRTREILDHKGENVDQNLSDVTALAALICQVPVSTITLIDAHDQYIRGHHGVADHLLCLPREEGLCKITIQDPEKPTIIYDALIDSRVQSSPFVNGDYDRVRFYAGLPLTTPEGVALGSICVLDHQPRELTEDQMMALKRLRALALRILLT